MNLLTELIKLTGRGNRYSLALIGIRWGRMHDPVSGWPVRLWAADPAARVCLKRENQGLDSGQGGVNCVFIEEQAF